MRQNWGTLRSVQYLAVQRLLRIVLCVPICNSGADRKWGGIKTEQPTGTTKIAWRRAFSQFLELVNWGVLTACLRSRNLYFVSRKPWVIFAFYGSEFFFVHDADSKLRLHNIVSQRGGPGSIPIQSMWHLWRKKSDIAAVFSKHLGFPLWMLFHQWVIQNLSTPCFTRRTKGRSWEPCKKQCSFGKWGPLGRKVLSYLAFKG